MILHRLSYTTFTLLLVVAVISIFPATSQPLLEAALSARQADIEEAPFPEIPTDEPSPGPTEEPEDGDEICVEHSYLSHRFKDHELVHGNAPILSNVFCVTSIPSLPCMTRNHMVQVNGQDISAEQLCRLPGKVCEQKRLFVNSVFTHIWENEKHKDATLTMFDVRHPKVLQLMLHRAIALARSVKMQIRNLSVKQSVSA